MLIWNRSRVGSPKGSKETPERENPFSWALITTRRHFPGQRGLLDYYISVPLAGSRRRGTAFLIDTALRPPHRRRAAGLLLDPRRPANLPLLRRPPPPPPAAAAAAAGCGRRRGRGGREQPAHRGAGGANPGDLPPLRHRRRRHHRHAGAGLRHGRPGLPGSPPPLQGGVAAVWDSSPLALDRCTCSLAPNPRPPHTPLDLQPAAPVLHSVRDGLGGGMRFWRGIATR